ncbi:RDD family protein [Roseicyclus sp. F158]|uniref:RDD family protein n=1 Tax=Tropicimonas omnivorans TaxID=3075590 RepID=A0ABU3DJB2_9RHOB|nr:RDD family protein [Roseicyclus sp. F158]MDT0683751.1 RDD family protein [Roseicyclus sp. F158]
MSRTVFPGRTGLPDPEDEAEFYADVPLKRLIAWIVDTALIAVLVVLGAVLTLFIGLFFLPVLWFTISFAYRGLTIMRSSATPGMRLMGIELLDKDGARLSSIDAWAHTGLYAMSIAFVSPQVISLVTMAVTPRGKSLVDMLLGTAMVNRS